MNLNFKQLSENAVLPKKAHEADAGFDIVATSVNHDGYYYTEYGTGLAVEIPKGYVGLIFPRSSLSKYDLLLCNSVGVIDSGYLGEIKFRFKRVKNFGEYYKIGDKIGQLIVMPIPMFTPKFVDELADSERGVGGFGSSGN